MKDGDNIKDVLLETQSELPEEDEHFKRLNSSGRQDDFSLDQFTIEDDDISSDIQTTYGRKIIFNGHTVILDNQNIFKNHKLKFQMLASMLALFLIGLTDQAIGSLIEHFLDFYKIDRIKLSYLFVAQFCGYIPSSFMNNFLMAKFGLYNMYWTSCVITMLVALIYFMKLPYPYLVFASVGFGWTNGTLDCCMNYFVGTLDYSNELLGLMHSFYGVGCLITPSLSVFLIQRGMPWSRYYLILMGVGLLNLVLALSLFKNETNYKYRYLLDQANNPDVGSRESSNLENTSLASKSEPSMYETMLNKYIAFYSLSLFLYVGSELSVGVWLNNYMFKVHRLTEDKASFIVSTFWFWMTFGRFVLGIFTGRYFVDNEARAIVAYCWFVALGCCGFWIFEANVLLQTIFISIAGFFVGPIFGTTIIIAIKTLPKRYSVSGISLIAGLGGTGAAIIPSIMGYISEQGSVNPGDGAGLIYFPEMISITFASCAAVWLAFYVINKGTFDAKKRLV